MQGEGEKNTRSLHRETGSFRVVRRVRWYVALWRRCVLPIGFMLVLLLLLFVILILWMMSLPSEGGTCIGEMRRATVLVIDGRRSVRRIVVRIQRFWSGLGVPVRGAVVPRHWGVIMVVLRVGASAIGARCVVGFAVPIGPVLSVLVKRLRVTGAWGEIIVIDREGGECGLLRQRDGDGALLALQMREISGGLLLCKRSLPLDTLLGLLLDEFGNTLRGRKLSTTGK